MMTDDDAGGGGEGGKNGDFWMTSFVNDPLYHQFKIFLLSLSKNTVFYD